MPATPALSSTHWNTQGCSGSPGAGARLRAARQKGLREDSGRIPETRSASEVEEAGREELFQSREPYTHAAYRGPPPTRGPGEGLTGQGPEQVLRVCGRTLPLAGWSPRELAATGDTCTPVCTPAGPLAAVGTRVGSGDVSCLSTGSYLSTLHSKTRCGQSAGFYRPS